MREIRAARCRPLVESLSRRCLETMEENVAAPLASRGNIPPVYEVAMSTRTQRDWQPPIGCSVAIEIRE